MTTYISELDLSLNEGDCESLRDKGFHKIQVNLNKGAGGNCIYLWFKKGPKAITGLQVSFNDGMATGLINAGYKKINKNLNAGTGGDHIYLWYLQGSGEYHTPIEGIEVTTDAKDEAAKFGSGWERLACNLNRGANGNWIYILMKREKQTFICNIAATDSYESQTDLFGEGYIRVDEYTNRGAGGSDVFIWYRQTTDPKRALTDLKVSISDKEYVEYTQKKYSVVEVNNKTSASKVNLWYKKEGSNTPIKAITVLLNTVLAQEYKNAGVTVIEKNLNAGNDGDIVYLCVYQ